MVIMQGSIPIKPGQFDRALVMAHDLIAATRGVAGCITYEFYRALSDPDALVDHLSSPYLESFLRRLPEIFDGGITTRRYLVQDVEEAEAEVVFEQPPIIH